MKKLILLLVLATVGCSHSIKNSDAKSKDEVSLKADRSNFDDLRKDMSPQARKENDELAGLLQILRKPEGEYEKPEKIRERFNKIMRDRRSRNDKQFRIEREDFNRLEKDEREEFTAKQKDEREDFNKGKPSSEARRRFSDKQEQKRTSFYEDSREKRRTFEAQISTRRKDYEDFVREKTNLFNQEYRNYQKEFDERMKGEDLKRRAEKKGATLSRPPVSQPDLSGSTQMNENEPTQNEFNEIPQGGSQLGTEDK